MTADTRPVLVAENIRKTFGGLVAVDVDAFAVRPASITALIGPNGAGKSTFFNLLTGFDRPDRGRWALDGVDVSGMRPHQLARRGMVRTFQLTRVLSELTVEENLLLAAPGQRGERLLGALLPNRWRAQERAHRDRAKELLDRFNLAHLAHAQAGVLSGGQRKLLEMARALMCQPRLLLLDEPMAGVNPRLVESLIGHMRQVRDEGVTVLFIEHNMDVVAEISDEVWCMAAGQVLCSGTPRAVMTDPAVIDAYLGADSEPAEPMEVR